MGNVCFHFVIGQQTVSKELKKPVQHYTFRCMSCISLLSFHINILFIYLSHDMIERV